MNPSRSSGPPADFSVPPSDQVIPVEEWDWEEINRIEDVARERLRRNPRCEKCGNPMVLGQQRTHHTCRPPAPPQPSRRKLPKK